MLRKYHDECRTALSLILLILIVQTSVLIYQIVRSAVFVVLFLLEAVITYQHFAIRGDFYRLG